MSTETLLNAHNVPKAPATTLAIHGGAPVRPGPMPPRMALGDAEHHMVNQVLTHYREQKADPGYQGPFEKLYTDAFVKFMGGGYADAVATGTAALWVGIAAMDLPKGSEVLVSPITDPGTLSTIILLGLKPRLIDSMPGSYNIGPAEFEARITPGVKGAVLVHSIGQACAIDRMVAIAKKHGIKVLEDSSQSHGASLKGRPVGSFGDIAAFSTMYRKAHITGASGGVVYASDLAIFQKALAHADRGKARWVADFDDRNPNTFLFPALNLHTDEISCGIGLASLGRLTDTIVRRLAFVSDVSGRIADESKVCTPYGYNPGDSPFVYPVFVDTSKIRCSKVEFARAVEKEGIGLNVHYQYAVAEWPWVKPYLADGFDTPNARDARDRSFCLYLNENYGEKEARDVAAAILKVERHYAI